jgi:sigma-B regulation protein RsbU (phosphoserine phosphatase)
MDSILIYGFPEEKIQSALNKMGYHVLAGTDGVYLSEFLKSNVIDLLFVSGRGEDGSSKLIMNLKEDPATRRIPILYLTDNQAYLATIKEHKYERFDFVERGATLGAIISKAATLLRMRKMVVAEKGAKQDVFDLNAHLRDLTEKHKKEIEEAKQIQENLLPKEVPCGDGYEVEVCYIPLEELGGDYYDVKANQDGSISMLVADATGHGLPAAFISSMTKMAMVAVNKVTPAELFLGMNGLMTPQMAPGRFITMAAANYSPQSGRLVFSRAGHPPALVLSRAEGRVAEMRSGGFAIGFMSDADYSQEELTLQPGDIMVMITDGITEAQNRGLELFGQQRISAVLLASSPTSSAKEVLNAILGSFKDFIQGRILKDDVTMIVLKRN